VKLLEPKRRPSCISRGITVPDFPYCRIIVKPQELLYCDILHVFKTCCDLLPGQSLQDLSSFRMLLLPLLLLGLKLPDGPRLDDHCSPTDFAHGSMATLSSVATVSDACHSH